MEWFRWYAGTVTDPKWRVISRRSGQPIHVVLAVWAIMLEHANNAGNRGELEAFEVEDVGAALDLEPDEVRAVLDAMQGKVLNGQKLKAWEKRQPKREREDRTAAERKRRQRQVEPRHAKSHHVTPSHALEESRVEERLIKDPNGSMSGSDEPNADQSGEAETRPDTPDEVRQVFDYWRTRCGHELATLTKDRRAKIKARLKVFTAKQLEAAIEGARASPFHQGENDRQTRFDWLETIFKTDSSTEKLMLASQKAPDGKPIIRESI